MEVRPLCWQGEWLTVWATPLPLLLCYHGWCPGRATRGDLLSEPLPWAVLSQLGLRVTNCYQETLLFHFHFEAE